MATEREYLAGLGLAKAGARGRFSNAAVEALTKAKAEGMTFDAPVVKPAPAAKPAEATAAPKAPRVTVAPETVKPLPSLPEVPNSFVSRDELKRNGRAWARYGDQLVGYKTCFTASCRKSVVDCTCADGPAPPVGYTRISEREAFAR